VTAANGPPAVRQDPGVNSYSAVCLAALALILVVLLRREVSYWSLLPIGIGLIGIVTRWSSAPVLLLLTVAACTYAPTFAFARAARRPGLRVPDLFLCVAAFAYVVAHYRLQSLLGYVFPPPSAEQRGAGPGWLRRRQSPEVPRQRRASRLVTQEEVGRLVLSLPLWAGLAQVGWNLLPADGHSPDLLPWAWQAILVSWVLGLGGLLAAGLFDYWSRRQMTTEEAALFLQDVLWKETRREQRRLNRWLAWARLRRQRRQEKTRRRG
jgi:hypothetical protein